MLLASVGTHCSSWYFIRCFQLLTVCGNRRYYFVPKDACGVMGSVDCKGQLDPVSLGLLTLLSPLLVLTSKSPEEGAQTQVRYARPCCTFASCFCCVQLPVPLTRLLTGPFDQPFL